MRQMKTYGAIRGRSIAVGAGLLIMGVLTGAAASLPDATGARALVGLAALGLCLIFVPSILATNRSFPVLLAALTCGTVIGEKSFAYLGLQLAGTRLYITDLFLVLLLLSVFLNSTRRSDLIAAAPTLLMVGGAFLGVGTVLLLAAFPAHGLQALRDYAIFYYTLFIPIGFLAARDASFLRLIRYAYPASLILFGVRSVIFGSSQDIGYGLARTIPGQSSVYLLLFAVCTFAYWPAIERGRIKYGVAGCAAALGVVAGLSRSAFLAGVVGAAFILVGLPTLRKSAIPFIAAMVGSTLLVALGVSAIGGQLPVGFQAGIERGYIGVFQPANDPTASFRLDATAEALRRFHEHPLTGEGLGVGFSFTSNSVIFDLPPHDTYLTVLVKSGMIGAGALLSGVLAIVVMFVRRPPPRSSSMESLRVALAASLVCMLVFGGLNLLLESPFLAFPFWTIAGATVGACSHRLSPRATDEWHPGDRPRASELLVAADAAHTLARHRVGQRV